MILTLASFFCLGKMIEYKLDKIFSFLKNMSIIFFFLSMAVSRAGLSLLEKCNDVGILSETGGL